MTELPTNTNGNLIWAIAELLRGDFKQSEYQKVILPLTVLRRLDAVLADGKTEFLEKAASVKDLDGAEKALRVYSKHGFYNRSPLDFEKLTGDPDHLVGNLRAYIAAFSEDVRDVIGRFNFDPVITRLNKAGLLYKVVARFAEVDLHPKTVSNLEMGYLYEELIRKFSELSNETAGEHFTPREVIRLMVNLLFSSDDAVLTQAGKIATVYDPACGTGGMLSVAEDHIRSFNPDAVVAVYGQELNDETYAVCRSDMMVKGQDAIRIVAGNSFTEDGHPNEKFDYMLANPPFGVDWSKYADPIVQEHKKQGFDGRFGPGLPRKSDGSMLFLCHMISKMKAPEDGGSRIAIVFNASPLFTGTPGGGESEIRRWIIENDWLEAIVALPEQLFYNTGIATYVWIVTNVKAEERRGLVQLIDAREIWEPMRKSLGDKRRYISDDQIEQITRIHDDFTDADDSVSKVFPNHHFGFQRITVEQPLRLTWVIDEETIENVKSHKTFEKLGKDAKGELKGSGSEREKALGEVLEQVSAGVADNFDSIWRPLTKHLEAADVPSTNQIKKLVYEASSRQTPEADPITDGKGASAPDPDLRDTETVPLPPGEHDWSADPSARLESGPYRESIDEYMKAEVIPWVADAWVDHSKTKLGYEIPFTREFYVYQPPRPLEEIDADIEELETIILSLLEEVRR